MLVGPGRERRRGRRRRRHRRRHPHREPQPPVGHRALPGRGHRRRRHPPRHLHHGRPADRPDGPAALRSARRPPQPLDRRGRRVAASPATATRSACRPSAARSSSTRRYAGQPAGQRAVPRRPAHRAAGARPGHAASATSPCCSARPPGATASAASACWPRPASATTRPTPPSARACRSATRSRRSGSSRRASTLLDAGLVVGIQDLGGAGLTCATSETASARRRGHGRRRVAPCPAREPGMEPFEVMTSESPGADAGHRRARATSTRCSPSARGGRCGPRSSARVTERRRAAHPRRAADGDGPGRRARRRRCTTPPRSTTGPLAAPADLAARRADDPTGCPPPATTAAPTCSALLADTVVGVVAVRPPAVPQHRRGPGGDATVLRLKHPATGADTGRGLALTTDGNHRWCAVDPAAGTAMVVAESVLNLACVGARPLRRRQLPQLRQPRAPRGHVAAVRGDRRHGRGLPGPRRCPVIGGNVSLYNETRGRDIDPTPVVGVLGLSTTSTAAPPGVRLVDGGQAPAARRPDARPAWPAPRGPARRGHLGGHAAAARPRRCTPGCAPRRPGPGRRRTCVAGVHDVADGGLAVALAEMAGRAPASASRVAGHRRPRRRCSPRPPSRVVVCVAAGEVAAAGQTDAAEAGLSAVRLGTAGGDRLVVEGLVDLPLDDASSGLAGRPAGQAGRRGRRAAGAWVGELEFCSGGLVGDPARGASWRFRHERWRTTAFSFAPSRVATWKRSASCSAAITPTSSAPRPPHVVPAGGRGDRPGRFVRALERIEQCGGERQFGGWVQIIARHMCVDALRARSRVVPSESPRSRAPRRRPRAPGLAPRP